MWKKAPVPDEIAVAIASGQSRIRAFREAEGVSPNTLALAVDISVERLLQIEKGAAPTDEELLDISNALAVSVATLSGA